MCSPHGCIWWVYPSEIPMFKRSLPRGGSLALSIVHFRSDRMSMLSSVTSYLGLAMATHYAPIFVKTEQNKTFIYCVCMHAMVVWGEQRTVCRNQFSTSTMRVLGWNSGQSLLMGTFTRLAIFGSGCFSKGELCGTSSPGPDVIDADWFVILSLSIERIRVSFDFWDRYSLAMLSMLASESWDYSRHLTQYLACKNN